MKIDKIAAQRHLRLLDATETKFIFSAFTEAPQTAGPAHQLSGELEDLSSALNALQEKGYGIFFAVNAFRSSRRRKAEIKRVRAIIADMDGPQSSPWPLQPSLRIRTSSGREQVYWLVDVTDPPSAQEAEVLQKSLAVKYGADRQATDVTRLFRLAGTWHQKQTPSPVVILDDNGRRFRRGELTRAFPAAAPPRDMPTTVVSVSDAVERAIGELGHASAGTRNGTLNRVAFRLGQLGFDLVEAHALLTPVAHAIGLYPYETAATIRSGHRAGSAASIGRLAR